MTRGDAGNQALICEAIPGDLEPSARSRRVPIDTAGERGSAIIVRIEWISVGRGRRVAICKSTESAQC
jgi:hypothetical protein